MPKAWQLSVGISLAAVWIGSTSLFGIWRGAGNSGRFRVGAVQRTRRATRLERGAVAAGCMRPRARNSRRIGKLEITEGRGYTATTHLGVEGGGARTVRRGLRLGYTAEDDELGARTRRQHPGPGKHRQRRKDSRPSTTPRERLTATFTKGSRQRGSACTAATTKADSQSEESSPVN